MSCSSTESQNYFAKDPDADLDYKADWTSWMATGDTIVTSEWIVPDGIEHHDEAHDATTATIWLRGGTKGTRYAVVNRITTAQQRVNDQTLFIEIEEK